MSRPEPLKAVQQAVEYARKQNKLISCDINWRPCLYDKEYAQEKMLPVLCRMDILKFSQEEIELLTDAQDIEEGCEKLAEKGVRLVVVTRGARGCYYYYAGGRGWIPTYAVKVVDTNAAGDAFMGAMIWSYLYAGMVELVDSKDLGSFANRRVGSNPTTRTKLRAFSSVG